MFLYDVVDDSERRRGRQKHLLTLLNFNILFGCSLEWKSTDIDTSDFTLAGESSGMLHKRTSSKSNGFLRGKIIILKSSEDSLWGNLLNPPIMMTTSNTHEL